MTASSFRVKAKGIWKDIWAFYLRCKRNRNRNEEGCRFCGSENCVSRLVREAYWLEEWNECLDCGALYVKEVYGNAYGACAGG